MTIEPITNERLAEIRANVNFAESYTREVVAFMTADALALLSRLDKAEGRDRTQATFEVHQDGAPVAMASGPRERAYAEAMHYAAVYGQDSPVEVFEMVPVALLLPPSES